MKLVAKATPATEKCREMLDPTVKANNPLAHPTVSMLSECGQIHQASKPEANKANKRW